MKVIPKAMLGVSLAAFAASLAFTAGATDPGLYRVNFKMTNQVPIYTVYAPPVFTGTYTNVDLTLQDYTIHADGAGKLSGFVLVTVNSSGTRSSLILKVTGALSTKGDLPAVQMKLSGTGTSSKGPEQGNASLNLQFVGAAAATNPAAGLNGEFKGTFKSGIAGTKPEKIDGVAGTLSSIDGGTQILSCILQLTLSENKAALGGCLNLDNYAFHNDWYSTGEGMRGDKFSLNLKATGPAKGASITLEAVPTDNVITGGADLSSVSAKGKMLGQKVKTTGGTGSIVPMFKAQ